MKVLVGTVSDCMEFSNHVINTNKKWQRVIRSCRKLIQDDRMTLRHMERVVFLWGIYERPKER